MSSLACKNVKIQDTNGNVASTISWDGNNVTFDKPVLVPTAPAAMNNTQVATTAMVHSAIANDLNVTGSAPMYACRAWVNYNGSSPAIRAGGNVSSVTKNGTGDYTVNFTTAMPDANYNVSLVSADSVGGTCVCKILSSNSTSAPTLKSTTQLRVGYGNGGGSSGTDVYDYSISIFR